MNRFHPLLALLLLWQLALPTQAATPDEAARELVEQWLALLDRRETNPDAYRTLLSEQTWQLQLVEGAATSLPQLATRLSNRFAGLSASHTEITYFKAEPRPEGAQRLWLELAWQGRDSEGLEALARYEVALTLTPDPHGRWRIQQLQERYLAPLQSNGARIKC